MRLNEIFTKPYVWELLEYDAVHWDYMFRTNDNAAFQVSFVKSITPNVWHLVFGEETMYGLRFDITNLGDQYKIFSTVIDVILDFKQKHSKGIIRFIAEEPSRIRLYSRMARTLTSKYNLTLLRTYDAGSEMEFYIS